MISALTHLICLVESNNNYNNKLLIFKQPSGTDSSVTDK